MDTTFFEDPLLEAQNLNIAFRSKSGFQQIVNDLSFQVFRGKTLGIAGESGSGKSMTALSILKLLPSNAIIKGNLIYKDPSGTFINLATLDSSAIRKYRGRHISIIFQDPMTSLNPLLTCGEQVSEIIRLHHTLKHKQAKELTISLFKDVNLPDTENFYYRYPFELSGGQRQRVVICMAIACQPSLLIADEPTTALDVSNQRLIIDIINFQKQKLNLGVIFISHDLDLLSEISDNIIIMKNGTCVEKGKTSDILHYPKSPYTRTLLECKPHYQRRNYPLPTNEFTLSTNVLPNNDLMPIKDELPQQHQDNQSENREILNTKNLVVSFKRKHGIDVGTQSKRPVINNVSLTVYAGETLGVVGESGAGKTTLARAILQLIKPGGGSISWMGTILNELTSNEIRQFRKQFQIVFQDPYSALNPRKSCGYAIAEPMLVHRIVSSASEARIKVIDLLKKVGLDSDFYKRYPHELSGGERQRICIARALAVSPRFIVFDESVASLDLMIQAQLLNLINDLKKALQLTILFISHDLNVITYMADRIIILKDGNFIESGNVKDILFNPTEEYTRSLFSTIIR